MNSQKQTENSNLVIMNDEKKKKTRRGGKKKKSKSKSNVETHKTNNLVEASLRYKHFIETQPNQELINKAMECRNGWEQAKANAPPVAWEEQPQTKWVRDFTTDFVNDRFKDIKIHDAIKVYICPLGLNNVCHHNAMFYSQHLKNCEVVFGYNVFACKCGKRIECEAHSINKVNCEYMDFTEDYDGEQSKWFIPIKSNGKTISDDKMTLRQISSRKQNLRTIDTLHSNRGCKCVAFKDAKQTEYGKHPIDKKIVESIISFWEQ